MRKEINRLAAFDKKKDCLNVIIETPKGSRVKYAYEQKVGLFLLKKALPEGMSFPFNFGFIPSTQGDDGDPLDILILNEEPLISGCLVKAELAGIIKAEQTEDGKTIRNDRLLGFAVPEAPAEFDTMKVDDKMLDEIGYFFTSYNKLEGKKFKVLGKSGAKKALAMVKKGASAYTREHPNGWE